MPPAGYGGIELVVSLLADGLVEMGDEVILLSEPATAGDCRVGWRPRTSLVLYELDLESTVNMRSEQ